MLQGTAYKTDIEDASFPLANFALKAQSESEGFYLRVAPIDSTGKKKKEKQVVQRDDYVTYQSNRTLTSIFDILLTSLTYYLHTRM